MKEVVIATYDRDYREWTKYLNDDVKITVYQKGECKNLPNEICIPNIGRDPHTHFYHIVKNYDNLADYTLTAQDFCTDHVSNYIEIVNGTIETYKKYAVQDFGGCWFFNDAYDGVVSCDKNGVPHHPGLNIEPIWNMLFAEQIPDKILFTPAVHFCVTRDHVKLRPKKFYEKIVSILETHEIAPWVIERLEPYIFDQTYKIINI